MSGKRRLDVHVTLAAAAITFLWGSLAMAESSNMIVFGAGPLAEEEVAATLDVLVAERQLGQSTDRLMKRGEISIGRAQIRPWNADQASVSAETGTVSKYDHYLVALPFSVHPAYEGTHYRKIVVRVHLSDPDFIAYDLLPERVTVARTIKLRYALSPEFKFRGIEAKAGAVAREIEFEQLYPVITPFGVGENTFYWVHEGEAGGEVQLVEGSTGIAVSLEVPKGTKRVSGTLSYAAEMRYEILGGWREAPASTRDYDFAWDLPI